MNEDLEINPFLRVYFEDEQTMVVTAPKPRSGLQTLEISNSRQPNLFELFADFAQTGLSFLNVEIDLNAGEREKLCEAGVLIAPENIPQKPLFACPLNEVETTAFDGDVSSLIVTPTFRFEPFNLANFSSWINEKHFSPRSASVWVKQPLTQIEIGYWLDQDQTAILSKFAAGEKLPLAIERDLLGKLIACGVLTTPERLADSEQNCRAMLERAKLKYLRDKYVVLPELLPSVQMKSMRRYYRQYVEQGFMPFDDTQSERFYQHNEPLARFFHGNIAKLMSLVIGQEVIPSYVYAGAYIENSELNPHTDRAQCEFSISFQVDYWPEQENHRSPWGLFLKPPDFEADGPFEFDSKEFPAASQAEDQNTAIYLKSGDGLVYKGRELIHYRYALPAGHRSTSLFFHYVAKDFQGELN